MPITESTYNAVMDKHGWACQHCGSRINLEWHHMLSNTKANRKKFPKFIDSEYNGAVLCGLISNNCHRRYRHLYRITDIEAQEFEDKLTQGGDV